MNLEVEDLADGVTAARLNGRMDIEGAQAVDMKFNVLSGTKKKLVIDMSGVTFIASMGLRTLMMCARSMASKGAKMAIAGAQPNVMKVLETSGMSQIVPVTASVDDAIAAVAG
ncbi:STAS domain-containing protein [Terricaulis silvestris]|uniref:Anti-sigma factor antagonist n=1 Tax=Terricaulis silvestris TaxID=2686094 RepID=A0A6I6MSW9_9CAUL|nr:STAS domain-containing protein [Terricaulis silvestris]QGZ95877.1 Anti-anti-sigma-B factor [Terricaulis silvestris]